MTDPDWSSACSFPIIVRRFPRLPVPHHVLFLSRHFGTGVLIATAFVHLLPTAFVSLTDPCLPPFWNEGYPAMPGLIAMTSVLVVVGIEMFFATKGAGHSHSSEYGALQADKGPRNHTGQGSNGAARSGQRRTESFRRFRQDDANIDSNRAVDVPLRDMSDFGERLVNGNSRATLSKPGSPSCDSPQYEDSDSSDLDLDELDPQADDSRLLNSTSKTKDTHNHYPPNGHQHQRPRSHGIHNEEAGDSQLQLSEQQTQQKMLLQCLLLEAGILFHSVFIGMALSVATGTSFIVLLVAISFHQTFEGLALGSRIAAITAFGPGSPKPWLMALAYGTTTPVGQAIGLLVHNLYDPYSQTGLLMVGIMNAISSGLLLFAGLVELLAEDFLSDQSYEILTGRRRLEACGAVVGGSMLMALVGAWA
ncbi:hypothetical protein LTR16_000737 [Cryomyces antarcticus]|uniref:Zinc/iron permease n=1 Tax=Cryomyces antarcticus TaxID=329879 RepID=A0ABR0LQU0_9PEZI|nr:hypothetical protein LTR39_001441 [Cryomyces antarcticus]KAK5018729.1 hypothetical protein LTR60_001379 [Cryomyces antarcticus]KAK5202003.1 hypothetical protein LTR16_000737 [Cryomyces antarcticus]